MTHRLMCRVSGKNPSVFLDRVSGKIHWLLCHVSGKNPLAFVPCKWEDGSTSGAGTLVSEGMELTRYGLPVPEC